MPKQRHHQPEWKSMWTKRLPGALTCCLFFFSTRLLLCALCCLIFINEKGVSIALCVWVCVCACGAHFDFLCVFGTVFVLLLYVTAPRPVWQKLTRNFLTLQHFYLLAYTAYTYFAAILFVLLWKGRGSGRFALFQFFLLLLNASTGCNLFNWIFKLVPLFCCEILFLHTYIKWALSFFLSRFIVCVEQGEHFAKLIIISYLLNDFDVKTGNNSHGYADV